MKIDKFKRILLVLFVVIILVFPFFVFAHPGGLDKSGCHTCKKDCAKYDLQDGQYHCHKSSTNSTEQSQPKKDVAQKESLLPNDIKVFVSSITDGDTIYVAYNKKRYKIRLIGIDAPELTDKNKETSCLAKEAKKYLENFIKNKLVILKSDPQADDKDKYDRFLRYIYLENDLFVNAELIKRGYAYALTNFPFQYKKDFCEYENLARRIEVGIWGGSSCFKKPKK